MFRIGRQGLGLGLADSEASWRESGLYGTARDDKVQRLLKYDTARSAGLSRSKRLHLPTGLGKRGLGLEQHRLGLYV